MALLVVGLVAVPAAGPTAATAGPARVGAPASIAASVLVDQVRAFRMDVRAMLRDYTDRYGDRLSAAERRRLAQLQARVDRQLTLVQVKVARADRIAQSSASRAVRVAAAHEASVAFGGAHASAIEALAEVEPILRPKLSLFEGLEAKVDLDDMLDRYEALGTAIRAFEDEQRI